MPIGGFVVNLDPAARESVERRLGGLPPVTVHGGDDRGNLVLVLETRTSREMDRLAREIGRIDGVLAVGLTYLNTEDELDAPEPTDAP